MQQKLSSKYGVEKNLAKKKLVGGGGTAIQCQTINTLQKVSEIWRFESRKHLKSGNICTPDFMKVGFQMFRFSSGWALAIALVPTIWPFEIWTFFGLDFKWLGFRISDPIRNQDHL